MYPNIQSESIFCPWEVKPMGAMKNDTNKEYFSCSQYEKFFTTKGNLKRHELVHTSKEFSRSHCDKKFSRSDKLKQQEEIHTRTRKTFSCSHCDKKFSRADYLKNHEEIHTHEHRRHSTALNVTKGIIDYIFYMITYE